MKKYLIAISAAVLSIAAYSAPKPGTGSYKIDIEAPQLKNDTVKLAMYFYDKIYVRDTLVLDKNGKGAFHKPKKLDEGVYVVFFSASKYFDVLIGDDQDFKIQIDTTDLVNKVFITDAEQTEKFTDYIKFLSAQRTKAESINKEFEKSKDNPTAKAAVQEKMKELDHEVTAYQQNIIDTYGNKTVGVVVKAIKPIEIPKFENEPDSTAQMKRYYYNRFHYFDNINLSEPRLLRTNMLPQKISLYLDKIVPQIPDTLTDEIVGLVEKSRGDTLTFQNMLGQMLNYGIKSKIMGMDKVTLTLSEKYYLSGLAKWADSTLLSDLDREVRKVKYNQIGAPAPNLKMEKFNGTKIDISNITADYVLLFFFEPSCGHCKKETPLLHKNVYEKYKKYPNFFEVVAFYIQTDRKEWKDFLDQHNLYDWVNAYDPDRTSYFWHWYDTSTTPGLYLLNKERKILAKKVDLDTLDKILEYELKKKK
ncbi:MAG: thioredoxin family protein [Prevotellaceae bacterium]|jgi:thiol-disulfide isomerase/thioredoxin|nr:thioredoxin family protein [Prevotellaceae bacterium]